MVQFLPVTFPYVQLPTSHLQGCSQVNCQLGLTFQDFSKIESTIKNYCQMTTNNGHAHSHTSIHHYGSLGKPGDQMTSSPTIVTRVGYFPQQVPKAAETLGSALSSSQRWRIVGWPRRMGIEIYSRTWQALRQNMNSFCFYSQILKHAMSTLPALIGWCSHKESQSAKQKRKENRPQSGASGMKPWICNLLTFYSSISSSVREA